MKTGGVGGNNEGLAFGATIAGGLVAMPLVFALNGKNASIPAGMYATAKLAVALTGEPSTAAQAMVDPAAAVSVAHGRGPACSGIRKMVDFALEPGLYVLQIAGNGGPSLPVMIARLP